MKTKDLFIWGGIAAVGYWLWKQQQGGTQTVAQITSQQVLPTNPPVTSTTVQYLSCPIGQQDYTGGLCEPMYACPPGLSPLGRVNGVPGTERCA